MNDNLTEFSQQEIVAIYFRCEQQMAQRVGNAGVTKIEGGMKCGEQAYIPYLRIWKGDELYQEFCQHALEGIEYKTTESNEIKQ